MLSAKQIAAYLEERIPGAQGLSVSGVARIPGGASRETWSCDAEWTEGGAPVRRGFIIRRDPTGSLLETDRQVEFRIYQVMAQAGVPVPPVYWMEEDSRHLERPFFVMGRMPGQTAPGVLAGPSYPGSRAEVARQKAEALAAIHRADWRALGVDFLGDAPSLEGAAAAEIKRWEEIMRREALEPQPVIEMALRWLKRHQPVAPAITVVHGDFRTGNFLYDSDSNITAVLDWEMVHLGDPMEDLAWLNIRSWRVGTELAGGLVSRETFYEMYEAAGGFPVDRNSVFFYEVLGNLKLVVIFLTGIRTFVEGRGGDLILAMAARLIPGIERELLDLLESRDAA